MQESAFARIGLLLGQEDHAAPFYREVLEHAGIPFQPVDPRNSFDLESFDILLLCGHGSLTQTMFERLPTWVRTGGGLVCSGGLWGLSELLGVEENYDGRHPANEVLTPIDASDRLWPEKAGPARFFGGFYARCCDSKPVCLASTGNVMASRKSLSQGRALMFGVHLGQSLRHMCLGRSVETDGIGPADGSARLDDGRLRAEDGVTLSFDKDRSHPQHADAPFFSAPHADVLRELWVRMILEAAEGRGKRVPMFWPWPEDATGAACVSIECEEFDAENTHALHNLLATTGANACWLVGQPGYPLDVYRNMRKWEHEVGVLFHPDEDGDLNEERLKIQQVAMTRMVGVPIIGSLRLPDGGWYRLDKLYEIADHTGCRVSLCKGGRQPGTAGFAFGSCHPFHPIRRDGHLYRVLEIPYQSYMPGLVVSEAALGVIIGHTLARHGCFHMAISSTAHFDGHVALTLRRAIATVKKAGLTFMLPGEIARWERARRTLRTWTWQEGDTFGINLVADEPLEGFTMMVSGEGFQPLIEGREVKTKTVVRLGTTWTVFHFDLAARAQLAIEFRRVEPANASRAA